MHACYNRVMRKVILFPGTGYTCNERLMVRLRLEYEKRGYRSFPIDYSYIPFKDIATVREAADIAAGYCLCVMSDLWVCDEDDLVFVSKSLGCISALKVSSLLKIRTRHILLTPTKEALDEFSDYSVVEHAVIGDMDPLMRPEDLAGFGASHGFPTLVINGVGHSLKLDDEKETEIINDRIIDAVFSRR